MKYLLPTLLVLILLPFLAFAAGPGDVADSRLQLQDTLTDGPNALFVIINRLIDVIYTLFLILSVVMILLTAYRYLTANGNEENIESAHRSLKWTIVAIAIALLSGGITFLIGDLVLPQTAPTPIQPDGGSLDIWNSTGGAA